MISDYRSGQLDTKSDQFRIITGIASLLALTIPVFGFNPVQGQIITQVFNVFILPLVIVGFLVLAGARAMAPQSEFEFSVAATGAFGDVLSGTSRYR